MEIYSYDYGLAQTEQDFVTAVDTFLTVTIGTWERVDTVSDTGSNRDYVWKSVGSDPDNYDDIFIRLRGESNNIYTYAYGSWTGAGGTGYELYEASYSYLPTGGYATRYWMWGDENFIGFTILNGSSGTTHTGYLGLIESTYVPETDPLPLLNKGHSVDNYTWHTSGRQYMHSPVASGEQQYLSYNWSTVLGYDRGLRETRLLLLPVLLRNSTASNNEVRGRPYGVYQVNDSRAPKIAPIVSASGVFLCFRDGSTTYTNRTYAYGPVAAEIDGFNMW